MRPVFWQWTVLLLLSVVFAAIFEWMHLPAALLLGPMAAGILVAGRGAGLRVHRGTFRVAQAIIGLMIARNIPASIGREMLEVWPECIICVLAVIAAASVLGWLLTRWRVLPGTTAIWGSSPGAAMTMMVMAEAYGADIRLVAFMQFLRVVMVTVVASLVAKLWISGSGQPVAPVIWFPALDWSAFAETLAVAAVAGTLALYVRVPAGNLLLPLVAGAVLQNMGLVHITLPPWLLAVTYAFTGWSVGLSFTRDILLHAARALPKVAASTLVLICACGALAALLVAVAKVDPLTAYLATSPGGVDSVAIIAASSNINIPFVMAMQTMRLLVTILVGPALARFIAARAGVTDSVVTES
jgi:membrane AbrB-like protein